MAEYFQILRKRKGLRGSSGIFMEGSKLNYVRHHFRTGLYPDWKKN